MSRLRWAALIIVGFLAVYFTFALVMVLLVLMLGLDTGDDRVTSPEWLIASAAFAILTVVLWAITRRIWRGGRPARDAGR